MVLNVPVFVIWEIYEKFKSGPIYEILDMGSLRIFVYKVIYTVFLYILCQLTLRKSY